MKIESMFCGRCNGKGWNEKSTIESYYNQLKRKWIVKKIKDCPNCDGTGELVAISLKNYRLMKHLIHTQNRELELTEIQPS